MDRMRRLAGLGAITDEADALLLDQFGTLHDGVALYPGVPEAMAMLRDAGKRLIILSNSGRRSGPNIARLSRIGLPPDRYDGFLSSGEVVWRLLASPTHPKIGNEDAATADLVLLLGSEADRIGLDAYRARLGPAARRGILCLCGNPDRAMVLANGGLAPAAGRIAEVYAEMGGPVLWIGKPGAAIYDAAFAMLQPMLGGKVDRARVWAVGDSVEHDVAGAAAQGCRSLLVLTGIMAGGGEAMLAEEVARWRVSPDAIIPAFA
jgi:ribonucleotide monophosphatase NagD (HAD superfamily)